MAIRHFSQLVPAQAEKYGERAAFRHRDEATNQWIATSWNVFSEKVKKVAAALAGIGVKEQENVATYTQNKPEGLIVDFAAYANRAVMVPLYATSSVAQIEYILKEAEVKVLCVGEQFQYDNAFEAMKNCPDLRQLIVFDRNVKLHADDKTSVYFDDFETSGQTPANYTLVETRTAQARAEDLCTIIYTSGTTGEPKGVMLDHANFMEAMRMHDERLITVSDQDVSLCFLPLTHIFERAWTYFCFYKGMRVDINLHPQEIQKTIREVRPTILCSVPRFWEKVYVAVQEKISSAKGIQRKLMLEALKVGKRYNLDYARLDKRTPWWLEFKYRFFDRIVFRKLRRVIGIENGNIFPVAGAPLSDTINEFLHACGIRILYGYGLSETTATVSCFDITGYELGSVGKVMPGVQVKIGKNNEIMVKGKTVMKGYYKKPEETAKVMTSDGWFKTGDAGKINPDGALVLTERIKDLFKTSNGKYIAPQAIESKVGEDKYIDQIAVIGDQRKYVTAIIIPAFEALKEYAAQKQIQYRNLEELVKNQRIEQLIMSRINELQKNFARFEQIKRFTLLPQAFTMETGELTNTLKIRRPVINQRYHDIIEAMYV